MPSYRYKLDNSDLTTGATETAATTYTPALALTEGDHTLYVQERDDTDNWSASGSKTIVVDVTAPDTTITGKPDNPTNLKDASFEFSASEVGSTFQCQLDGGAFAPCTSPASYSALSDGSHTFSVKATDAVGNTKATPSSYTWTIYTVVCTAPVITIHPQSQTICSGQTAAMSVVALGTAPLSYQWYQGSSGDTSSLISGATSSSYTTAALTQTTNYWVRVTNACGSVDSNTVTISITTERVSYTINHNASFSYTPGDNQITSWQGDLNDGYFDLPLADFDFQFYGSPVTNIRISTNGYITFGTDGTDWNNVSIPNVNSPNAIIAPFWDDLNLNGLTGERGVWWGLIGTAPNRQLVIEWRQVPSYEYGTEAYRFEVILYESTDRIKFQYLDVDSGTSHDLGASATVGIENFDGTAGKQFSYDTSSLYNGLAIEFIPEEIIQNKIYVGQGGGCNGNQPCFATIQDAIDSVNVPTVIKLLQGTYHENLILDSPNVIFLQGGWDASFTENSSQTTINGSITIIDGKIIIEGIVLE